MNDEHVAAYRRCSQAGDIDGLARTLAADVQLISPLSDRMTFRGERDVRLVLAVVYRTLRDWRWTAVAADGDAEMGGVENENGDAAEEEESDDEGSVDLENESDDEEEEIEGEAAEGGDDAMEVDEKPAAGATKPQEVMAH